jgi:hypothetical protein
MQDDRSDIFIDVAYMVMVGVVVITDMMVLVSIRIAVEAIKEKSTVLTFASTPHLFLTKCK